MSHHAASRLEASSAAGASAPGRLPGRGLAAGLLAGGALIAALGIWFTPATLAVSPGVTSLHAQAALTPVAPGTRPHVRTTSRTAITAREASVVIPKDLVQALMTGTASFEALAERGSSDWQVRDELQARYLGTQDPILRQTLLALLAEGPATEVLLFTARLLADADPTRRADGYQLLTALPLDNDNARVHVLNGLRDERDTEALGALLRGLQPGLVAAEEADPIADQLLRFSAHEDPRVRAEVLPQLAQWHDGEQLEAPYFSALTDSNAEVRGAAIAGVGASTVRSPRLRNALFDLASNVNENPEHRHSALQALLRFRLTRPEVELYRLLQAEVPLHPGGG